jgi:hypothetical protein
MVGGSKWGNWYLGFGGIFLSEVYRLQPSDEIKEALTGIIEEAAKVQEPTGGWFSSFGTAKKAKYPSEDHGQLTAMLYSTMLHMKAAKIPFAAGVLDRVEQYMDKQCGPGGITYGTGNRIQDTTGSRGGFALLGLLGAGRTDHKICRTYAQLLPRCFPNLRKGHHIGGWHMMGTVLGSYRLGPGTYAELTKVWLDKCIAEQAADGSFYLGDDEASGGEKGLFGSNRASTAAMAMLILGQKADLFKPPAKGKDEKEKKDSPFGKPKPK